MMTPLKALTKAYKYSLELDRLGIPEGTQEHELAVERFLTRATDEHCVCGKPLRFFETDGGLCAQCIEAKDRLALLAADERSNVMARLGVPPVYRDCTFSTWEENRDPTAPDPIPDGVARWAARDLNANLVIYGASVGTGKSHLATAALYSRVMNIPPEERVRSLHAYWISAIELAQRLSDELFAKEHPTREKCSRVGVLLLDDWGSEEKISPTAPEQVAAVLEERHRRRRPTVVTTNMTPAQMTAPPYTRVASRLLEGIVVEREGKDQRWEKHSI